jgi:hypothetical protein
MANAQVTDDVQSGNIRSRGAVIPQSRPMNEEAQTAVDQALAPPGLEGAANSQQAKQSLLERRESSLNRPRAQSAKEDARSSAPSAATGENSRYARVNGHWWYWTSDNRWVFYYRNQWVDYDPKTYGQYFPTAANTPNVSAISPASPRYGVGYRGDATPGSASNGGAGVRSSSPLGGNSTINPAERPALESPPGDGVGGDPNGGIRGGTAGSRQSNGGGAGSNASGFGESGADAESRAATSGTNNSGFSAGSSGSGTGGSGSGSGAGSGGGAGAGGGK